MDSKSTLLSGDNTGIEQHIMLVCLYTEMNNDDEKKKKFVIRITPTATFEDVRTQLKSRLRRISKKLGGSRSVDINNIGITYSIGEHENCRIDGDDDIENLFLLASHLNKIIVNVRVEVPYSNYNY